MIIPVAQRIKLIRPEAKSIFPYSNSLLIDDECKTIIDAGAGGNAYAEIDAGGIHRLIFSHIHFDHIHGVGHFKQAEMVAAKEEAAAYQSRQGYDTFMGNSLWNKLMNVPRDDRLAQAAASREDVNFPDFRDYNITGHLWEGRIIDCGHVQLKALHLPGHSPGHYAFYIEKDGILFSSDLDLAGNGPWYGAPYCDVGQLVESIRRIIDIKPAVLVTSHRRVFRQSEDDIPALFNKYLDIVLKREERVLSYIDQPRPLDELVTMEVQKLALADVPLIIFWNKVMFLRHLEHLIDKGMAKEFAEGVWHRI
ncbi:MAG: MBL fold metallo-hydrolase [Syntrophomonas sp.]